MTVGLGSWWGTGTNLLIPQVVLLFLMATKFLRNRHSHILSDFPVNAVPSAFLFKVHELEKCNGPAPCVGQAVQAYMEMHSVFERIQQLKVVVGAVSSMKDQDVFLQCLEPLMHLFFLERPVELTRAILSALRGFYPLNPGSIDETMVGHLLRIADGEGHTGLYRSAVVTLLECETVGSSWLRRSASHVSQHICNQIKEAFGSTAAGFLHLGRLDDAQEAISSLYSIVNRFGADINIEEPNDKKNTLTVVSQTMLMLLQGSPVPREVMTSVGSTLLAAIKCCGMEYDSLAYILTMGLLMGDASLLKARAKPSVRYDQRRITPLEEVLFELNSDLVSELKHLSNSGRIGAIRAVVSAGDIGLLCKPLAVESSHLTQGCLLSLAIEFLSLELSKPLDPNDCFHILMTLVACLRHTKSALHSFLINRVRKYDCSSQDLDSASDLDSHLMNMSLDFDEEEDAQGEVVLAEESMPPFIDGNSCALLMDVLWRHIEESEGQCDYQALEGFALLLEIIGTQKRFEGAATANLPSWEGIVEHISTNVTALEDDKKGKYNFLAAILPQIGASCLSNMFPNILKSVFGILHEPAVSRASSQFLKVFLKGLLVENSGSEGYIVEWRSSWSVHVLEGLLDNNPRTRKNVADYVLPVVLELDELSLAYLIEMLLETDEHDGQEKKCRKTGAVVCLLKVARKQKLIPALDAVVDRPGCIINVPSKLLMSAAFSSSEELHMSVLELACIHPKCTELPDRTDLEIVMHCARIGFRSSGGHLLHKWIDLFSSFIKRMLVALRAKMIGTTQRLEYRQSGRDKDRAKSVSVMWSAIRAHGTLLDTSEAIMEKDAIERLQVFLRRFSSLCMSNLYPGASAQRQVLAVELLSIILTSFSKEEWILWPSGHFVTPEGEFQSICPELLSQGSVQALIGVSVCAWDNLRSGVMKCLSCFPSPLPGFTTPQELEPLLNWATHLTSSPRLRESDAGARLLVLLYEKYVHANRLSIEWFPAGFKCTQTDPDGRAKFVGSLCSWLEFCVKQGEDNLLDQCKDGLAHGVLTTLRYTIESIDWLGLDESKVPDMKLVLARILLTMQKCRKLCMNVLADQTMCSMTAADIEDSDAACNDDHDDMGPVARVLVTGAWLTMKELSLLMAALSTLIPMEGKRGQSDLNLLDASHPEAMGNFFIRSLIEMKHNGAVDKTGLSFQCLCEQLFRSLWPADRGLPSVWTEAFFSRILESGQSRDDIVRRSSGIPFGLDAICRADSRKGAKALFPQVVTRLVQIALDQSLDAWPRAHAFNSLTHIFNDKALAANSQAFFAKGVCTVISGLADSCWEVRNAAALCFTALTTRMVGYKNVAASGSSRKSISAFEFFARYPSLHPFLEQEILSAAKQLGHNPNHVPPSLAPMLLMLARLLPSGSTPASTVYKLLPSSLIPSVKLCVRSPHMAVRQLAARALVPLVTSEDLCEFVSDALDQFPKDASIPDCNVTHGVLLTLRMLLRTHCDVPTKCDADRLAAEMKAHLWLIDNQTTPAAIRIEFIRILSILQTLLSQADFSHMRLEMSRILDGVILNAEEWSRGVDPLVPLWLKECVTLRLQDCFNLEQDLLHGCLVSSSYEVRAAALKQLSRRRDFPELIDMWLVELLVDQLTSVSNPKVLKRSILLFSYVLQNPRGLCIDYERICGVVLGIVQSFPHLSVRLVAMNCLGIVLKFSTKQYICDENHEALKHRNLELKTLLERYSDPDCSSIDDRLACAKLLGAFACSELVCKNLGDALMSVWAIGFALMEDDDKSVRHESGAAMASVLSGRNDENQGLHVEVIERKAFATMCHSTEQLPGILERLLKWIADPLDVHMQAFKKREWSAEGAHQLMSSTLDKIFDKECNEHEEILIRSQLAAKHLTTIPAACLTAETELIQHWIADILDCMRGMVLFVSTTIVPNSKNWTGGFTNIPSVFLPMYQAWLGLWSVREIEVGRDAVDVVLVQEFHSSLQREAVHPLLRCISNCVTKEYNLCDLEKPRMGWFEGGGFDPSFLVEL